MLLPVLIKENVSSHSYTYKFSLRIVWFELYSGSSDPHQVRDSASDEMDDFHWIGSIFCAEEWRMIVRRFHSYIFGLDVYVLK